VTPPSPSLLSLNGISRHPFEELPHFFQDAPTVRTKDNDYCSHKKSVRTILQSFLQSQKKSKPGDTF
jgi:hypothetical protein